MRIRSTKPEFWRSKTIASLDWDARLVLKGLESYVDDNGVGKDSVVLICADVFPHDLAKDSGTLARVSGALQKLAETNLLALYSVSGDPLMYVRRWKSIQRVDKPNKGRYPRPDGTMEYSEDVDESIGAGQGITDPVDGASVREHSRNPREDFQNPPETVAPGTGEQGNRGTGENPPTPHLETVTGGAIALAPRVTRSRQRIDAMNATARPVEVYTFMHDYEQASPTPMDQKTLSQIETAITPLIASGIPAEQVAAGIRSWEASDSFSPTQIPAFVHKAGAKAAAPTGVGKPTIKAVGWLNAADQLIEGMEA